MIEPGPMREVDLDPGVWNVDPQVLQLETPRSRPCLVFNDTFTVVTASGFEA